MLARREIATIVLAVGGGLTAGVLGASLTRSAHPEPVPYAAAGTSEEVVRPNGATLSEWRLKQLERRVAELGAAASGDQKAEVVTLPGQPSPLSEQDAVAIEGDDVAGLLEVEMAAYRQLLDAHSAEPVDAKWARTTAESFRGDFAHLDRSDLHMLDVECRSTSCTATLEWSSYGAASESLTPLLHHVYATNCSRELHLPPPADATRPYRAEMLFRCGQR